MPSPLHTELGLTDDEAHRVSEVLGREPNPLELALYAVMWSEHCSYKSSRVHLRRLPSEGEAVIVGPGENAGVISAGDGVAVALRIESHNHPSAVEPYQGAATGVGGILRDVFAMGARPIALLDALRFGPPGDTRSRWVFEGVVSGISGYGNAVGVPTVGGELDFDDCYAGNPLVNVMCVGVLPEKRLVLGKASGVGNLAVLLGASTGRDGIGGVSVLASAGLGEAPDTEKRPSVQVGDPFEEKRLIETCLEILDRRLAVGIQDLGGAGLTCAASETAARAGMGMDIDVTAVPRRAPSMTPVEVMTSESQERMLAIVAPSDLDAVLEIAGRWDVRAAVVGQVTAPTAGGGHMRVLDGWDGDLLADVPASSLAEGAPLYHRPMSPPADLASRRSADPGRLPAPSDCGSDLLALLGMPGVADPAWVYRQYDHQLFLNTVQGPGADAAALRLAAPGMGESHLGLVVSTDGCARWCALDPREGAALVVAEAALNVACQGGRPAALVDCLNFGNPEHPEVMWQLSESVDGIAAACLALSLPVVGGNVSLYNECDGRDIDPTPVVGVVGLVESLDRPPPGPVLAPGGTIVLLGEPRCAGLGGSLWAVAVRGHRGGVLPPLDLATHARLVGLVADMASNRGPEGLVGLHDVSAGGLGVALAEMALRSGVGFSVEAPSGHGELFSEAPSRVLVCCMNPSPVLDRARESNVEATIIGSAGGTSLTVRGLMSVDLDDALPVWSGAVASLFDPLPSAGAAVPEELQE